MSRIKLYNQLERALYGEAGLAPRLCDYLCDTRKKTWIGVPELLQAIDTDRHHNTPRSADYFDGAYNRLMACIDQLREYKLAVLICIKQEGGDTSGLAIYHQAEKAFRQEVAAVDSLHFDGFLLALNTFFCALLSLKPRDEFCQRLKNHERDWRVDLQDGIEQFARAEEEMSEDTSPPVFLSQSTFNMSSPRLHKSHSGLTWTTTDSDLTAVAAYDESSLDSATLDLNRSRLNQKPLIEQDVDQPVKPVNASSDVVGMARLIEAQTKQIEVQAEYTKTQALLLAAQTEQMKVMTAMMLQLSQGFTPLAPKQSSVDVVSTQQASYTAPVTVDEPLSTTWTGRTQTAASLREATVPISQLLDLYLGRSKETDVIISVLSFDKQGQFTIDDKRLKRLVEDLANFDIVIVKVLPEVSQWKAGVSVITADGLYQLNKAGTEVVQVLDTEALTALGLEAQLQAAAAATKSKSISAAIAEKMTALDQALTDKGGKPRRGLMKEAEKVHLAQLTTYRDALNQNHDVIAFAKDINKLLSRLVEGSAMGGMEKHKYALGQATNFGTWCTNHEESIKSYKVRLGVPPTCGSAHLETSTECGDQLMLKAKVDGQGVPHSEGNASVVHLTGE